MDRFWLSRLSDIREDVETSKYLGSIGSIMSRQEEAFLEDGTSIHVPRAQGLSQVPQLKYKSANDFESETRSTECAFHVLEELTSARSVANGRFKSPTIYQHNAPLSFWDQTLSEQFARYGIRTANVEILGKSKLPSPHFYDANTVRELSGPIVH